jgi:hypothetical protein
VNPSRLPEKARDSVCEQCHLAGEARIAHPGRQVSDFQPGQELEQVFSTYVFTEARPDSIRVISHVEQLHRSACARKSGGRLWCGTCHNPHADAGDGAGYVRERCLACHAPKLATTHGMPSGDCAGCHMPTRPSRDGGHTAFTDHRITRLPDSGSPEKRSDELRPWRKPPDALAIRNLGLAYIAVGERDSTPGLIERGRQLLASSQPSFTKDPAVLTSLGVASLRQRRSEEAVRLFEAAVDLQPGAAAYYVNLATALAESGKRDAAIGHLNHAIDLDPSLEVAYRRLVEIYGAQHREGAVREVFERYLKFRPQSLAAHEAIRNAVPE